MATTQLLSKVTDKRRANAMSTAVKSWDPSVTTEYSRFYLGHMGDNFLNVGRCVFNTNNIIISSSSKLLITCTVREQEYYCGNLTIRLSQTNVTPNNFYHYTYNHSITDTLKNATLASSIAYSDSACTKPLSKSSTTSAGTNIYFSLNLNNSIKANQTYYLYFQYEDRSDDPYVAIDIAGISLTHETYTRCGAPASVTLSGYIVPNGSFTVSWTAGTAGNANAIKGYRVFCASYSSGSTPSYQKSFDVGKDARSLSISAADITNGNVRGNYIKCSIQTLGSVSGYDSSTRTESSGGITINSLPNKPTEVSVSKSTLPSTGGTITLKASPGTDGASDNTPRTVYYSTSQSGAKTIMTNGQASVTVKATTTFYFWTFDSLEYSGTAETREVKINTKPVCNISLKSASSVATDTTVPTGYNYVLSPSFSAKKSNTTLGSTETVKYYYKILKDPNGSPVLEGEYGSEKELSISDIRSLVSIAPPYYYTFGATVNDGLETSAKSWFSTYYYVTGAPAIKNIYNKYDGSNADGMGEYNSSEFYFSEELCFDFVYDAGYIGKTFVLNNSSKAAYVEAVSTNDALRGFFKDCGITNYGNHRLSGYFLDKTDCSCQASHDMYRVIPFEIQNLTLSDCKPYTSNNINIAISSNNLGKTINNPKQFGINAESIALISSFEGKLSYQDKTETPRKLTINSGGTNPDTIQFNNIAYDNTLFKVNQDGTYTMTFTLSLTTAFGKIYSASKNVVIDYKETPKITNISIKMPNAGTNEVKEGQTIEITASYQNCYNSNQTLSFTTPYGVTRVWLDGSISNGKGEKVISFVVPKTNITKEVKELVFTITNNALTTTSSKVTTNIKFLRHNAPNIVLDRTDYKDGSVTNKGDLQVYFTFSDWGLDESLREEDTAEVLLSLYKDNSLIKSKTFSYTENLNSCLFDNISLAEEEETWETKTVQLEVTVTSSKYCETYYEVRTNTILVYNLTPTVAYRKNQLGINTKDPSGHDAALVVIGGAGGRNQIFYETNEDRPYCKVINFQFNGGAWGDYPDEDDIGVVTGNLPAAEGVYF